jgi:hypothetical protein
MQGVKLVVFVSSKELQHGGGVGTSGVSAGIHHVSSDHSLFPTLLSVSVLHLARHPPHKSVKLQVMSLPSSSFS